MTIAAAQARYDAMTDEHPDDDIYEADIETLRKAIRHIDCDDLNGRRYWDCERREKLIRKRITELEMASIKQLQQQLESAIICRAKLEKVAFANPAHGVVSALLEARAAEESCRAELQKALWPDLDGIEVAA